MSSPLTGAGLAVRRDPSTPIMPVAGVACGQFRAKGKPDLRLGPECFTTALLGLLILRVTFQVCLNLKTPVPQSSGGKGPAQTGEQPLSPGPPAAGWLARFPRSGRPGDLGAGSRLPSLQSSWLVSSFSVMGSVCSPQGQRCRISFTHLKITSDIRSPLCSHVQDRVKQLVMLCL